MARQQDGTERPSPASHGAIRQPRRGFLPAHTDAGPDPVWVIAVLGNSVQDYSVRIEEWKDKMQKVSYQMVPERDQASLTIGSESIPMEVPVSLPTAMKGIRIHQTGGSSVLRQETDLAIPAIDDQDVLVKVEYAGVNFIDIYQRTGVYPMPLPFTAGREGSGTVVGIGAHVRPGLDLDIGDRVAVFTQGTMAEYVSAPASGVMKLPAFVSTRSGAAIMLQGLTAWTMVRDAHRVEAGEVILVQAAAGGTGGLLVQMCKHLGATVIGTVSTRQKAQVARKHGCDHVILYKDVKVEREVHRLTDGKGCHAVLSGVGAATFEADLACTRRKGTLVSYGNSSGVVSSFGILALSKGNVKLVRPTLANYIAEREEFEGRSQELLELVGSGAVKIELGGMYTLDTLGRAQDDLASQQTMGKLLVKID